MDGQLSMDAVVKAPDGTEILQRDWPLPAGVRRQGSALLIHGLGEHSGRYGHVAKVLTSLGIWVRSYDQRGFGRSGGRRGVVPHANALVDDAQWMFESLSRDELAAGGQDVPFLIGHSMGGAVAARAAVGGFITPRGLVLSSPALAAELKLLDRVKLLIGENLMPDLALANGLPPEGISHDPQVVADYKSDPLGHDRISARLARFILDAGRHVLDRAPAFRRPTLVLIAGSDRLVDKRGAEAFAAALPAGVATARVYPDLFHELFNEREPDRTEVLRDLSTWFEARLSDASPSAAVR